MVLQWNIEAPYLAIPEVQLESSVLSSDQFKHCLRSFWDRFCFESLTKLVLSSSVANLIFDTSVDTLSIRDTSFVFYHLLNNSPFSVSESCLRNPPHTTRFFMKIMQHPHHPKRNHLSVLAFGLSHVNVVCKI